jgi:hypothetical protein
MSYASHHRMFSLFIALIFLSATACTDTCMVRNRYTYFEPVYSTAAEIKAAVKLDAAQPISQPGKIYFKDGYLFITEKDKGIHVIDNRNPKNPVAVSFLVVPGTIDLAIQGNYLLADSFVDLVVFDISNLQTIREVSRLEGVFGNISWMGLRSDTPQGIITNWRAVEQVELNETECDLQRENWGGIYYRNGIVLEDGAAALFSTRTFAAAPLTSGAATGIGGSMARFTILGNHLYALDGANLDVINIAQPLRPELSRELQVSWDIETVFPAEKRLYIGSQTGMYIFDLQVPDQPTLLSKYEHVRSCDPVVVDGNYAYVTLRNGTLCGGFTNQLEVIDIANPRAPQLLHIYPMTNPHGLGIDQGLLFLCDGPAGLKVFNISNIARISENLVAHHDKIQAFDVIPFQHVAMMIGQDGLYQYDYADPKNIVLLSQMPIKAP